MLEFLVIMFMLVVITALIAHPIPLDWEEDPDKDHGDDFYL